MKINNKNYIYLDTKVQDEFRKKLSELDGQGLDGTCVILGDSDFDYRNQTQIENNRVLNAPFNVQGVVYPLIYSGAFNGLGGYISVFARQVIETGENNLVKSYYNFPTDSILTNRTTPPFLINGKQNNEITFYPNKMGYILYFQTVLYNYIDQEQEVLQRFNENITMKVYFDGVEYLPENWDVVKDNGQRYVEVNDTSIMINNNSMFISKNNGNVTQNYSGKIELIGDITNIKKTVNFNF